MISQSDNEMRYVTAVVRIEGKRRNYSPPLQVNPTKRKKERKIDRRKIFYARIRRTG